MNIDVNVTLTDLFYSNKRNDEAESNEINKQNNATKFTNSDKANKLRIMLRQQKTIFKSTARNTRTGNTAYISEAQFAWRWRLGDGLGLHTVIIRNSAKLI